MSAARIIEAALAARTGHDARRLDTLIAKEIGASLYRPIGDKVNNFGLTSTSGSYDFKLIENVTNMQDALLERSAGARFGNLAQVPYATPREAAASLFAGRGEAELARAASVEFFQADAPARTSKRITALFRDEGCGIEPSYVADSIFALGSAHKSNTIWQQGAFGIGGGPAVRPGGAGVVGAGPSRTMSRAIVSRSTLGHAGDSARYTSLTSPMVSRNRPGSVATALRWFSHAAKARSSLITARAARRRPPRRRGISSATSMRLR